ncbi:hypothetical protein, partial [Anaerotignum lactatifermentans]|uniref:hypothetical protein n=1 Tax=Anaerotignum lactatifermentans TaxID=160404 RepID=UPI003AB79509
PSNQSKVKGLATCNLQTTSPSGFLNNFNLKILSNFLGAVHIGFQLSILSIPYTQNTISLWKFKNKYIFNKILS